jgi:hypothetical protein
VTWSRYSLIAATLASYQLQEDLRVNAHSPWHSRLPVKQNSRAICFGLGMVKPLVNKDALTAPNLDMQWKGGAVDVSRFRIPFVLLGTFSRKARPG